MSWPGYDPFYQHNTIDNNARKAFMGVNSTPTIWVDCVSSTNFPPFAQFYDARVGVPPQTSVEITGSYDSDTRAGHALVTVTTLQAFEDGQQYRVYLALTEDHVPYAASNGVQIHGHTMRKMYPYGTGTVIDIQGPAGTVATFETDFALDPIYVESECRLVAWCQRTVSGDKEVMNANRLFVTALGGGTGVDPAPAPGLALGRNYPNPFNPTTVIPVSAGLGGDAVLQVLDVTGRVVRTLHSGHLDAGSSEFAWDGRDGTGEPVASGVYLARLQGAGQALSQRMVLLK